MTREELFRAVGEVREDQIMDAAEKPNKTAARWRRYGALAACLAVVLAGAFGFNRWLHTGHDLPAYDAAQEESVDAGGGLDGSDYSTDGPLVPQYSVGAEIGEIDGSGWGGLFNGGVSSDASLVWLDPEEILAMDTAIFRGTVTGLRYFEVTVDGAALYYTVASVEVSDCLRGDLAAGDTYNVLYAGAPGWMTTSISGDLENLDVGSEAVFMPRIATPDTGWSSGDDYFCYADLAELYMDEGRRFLFLDTGDGVSYAAEVYDIPAADGETVTLDDVTAYLREKLGTEAGGAEDPAAGTHISEVPLSPEPGGGEASAEDPAAEMPAGAREMPG